MSTTSAISGIEMVISASPLPAAHAAVDGLTGSPRLAPHPAESGAALLAVEFGAVPGGSDYDAQVGNPAHSPSPASLGKSKPRELVSSRRANASELLPGRPVRRLA